MQQPAVHATQLAAPVMQLTVSSMQLAVAARQLAPVASQHTTQLVTSIFLLVAYQNFILLEPSDIFQHLLRVEIIQT